MKVIQSKYFQFLIVVIAYILANGYLFNTGDQAEHLPQVYQKLNPSLYPNDFFLNYYNNTFTVRYYFVWLVYAFSAVLGVQSTCFFIYFVCLYAAIAGTYFLINYFYHHHLKSLLGLSLYFFVFRNFTVGGNYIQDDMLVGSSLAEALCIWAFVAGFKNKYLLSGMCCGIAALFQPLIGMQVALIIGIYFILTQVAAKQYQLTDIFRFGFSFIFLALFVLIPVFIIQFKTEATNQIESNKILFEYRGALHYLPQLFPINDYLKLTFFTLSTLFILLKFKSSNRNLFLTIIFSIIIICFLVTLVLYINPNSNIGKIQWFKTTVWLGLFNTIVLVNLVSTKWIKTISISTYSILLLMVLLMTVDNYAVNKYSLNKFDSLQHTHYWIKENTRVNAQFLAPPNDYSFNCEAQRSTVVNYKAIVHETNYLIAWKNAMEKYYEMDFTKIEKLDCLPSAVRGFYKIDFSQYPNKEVDYVLLAKSARIKTNYNKKQVCYENKDYLVLKLK